MKSLPETCLEMCFKSRIFWYVYKVGKSDPGHESAAEDLKSITHHQQNTKKSRKNSIKLY